MATNEMFKKVLYTGVGMVSNATERVKKSIEEMSNLSEDAQVEGKKVMDEMMGEAKTRRQDVESRFKKIIDTVLGQFDLPNRTEAEKLNARIAELEEKLAASKKTVTKRVTKKATTAKSTAKSAVKKVVEVVKK